MVVRENLIDPSIFYLLTDPIQNYLENVMIINGSPQSFASSTRQCFVDGRDTLKIIFSDTLHPSNQPIRLKVTYNNFIDSTESFVIRLKQTGLSVASVNRQINPSDSTNIKPSSSSNARGLCGTGSGLAFLPVFWIRSKLSIRRKTKTLSKEKPINNQSG